MNIKNCTNAVAAYKAASFEKEARSSIASGAKEKNVDKADFSASRNNTEGLKASVAKKVDAQAPAERIAALKNLISEGKYHISAENIALSILEA